MKRRTILVGLGGISAGASTLVGSGAFSAARIQRETSIAVVPDSDALVGLGPCPAEDRTSAYVVEENGQFALQISEENDNFAGDGVNVESIYWFDNVFEVCNQSDHGICIDFHVDVPEVPGPVPNEYDFEAGDDAVVFYRGDDRDAVIDVSDSGPRGSGFSLDPGECLCVGFVVRAFGFDAGTDIFQNATLTIGAFAGDDCDTEEPGGGDDGDGGNSEDGEDEPDETEDFEDLTAISFVAFCTGDDTVPDIQSVDVKNTKDNGEPVEIEWESNDAIEEVVLFGGQEWYLFDVDNATQGTALMSADDSFGAGRAADDFAAGNGSAGITFGTDGSDYVRCQSSPCYGEKGFKVEESGGSFDVADGEETNKECNKGST